MRYQVTDSDTAEAMGSGKVPALATPRLIAWMEAAAVSAAAPFLRPGQTTVGAAVRIEHRRPTPIGAGLDIVAEPPASAAGHRLTFSLQAIDSSGTVVAAGEIDRAIVDWDQFIAGLPPAEPEQ